MTYTTLKYEIEDGLLILTLNRPEKLNAFNVEMADELERAFDQADKDDNVRAVIVTGEGRAFCAGMDLGVEGNVFGLDETVDPMGPEADKIRDTGGKVTLRIFRMTKPVIGAINGVAVGIGATMTLAMDARVMSAKGKIGFVFSKIGICMEACSSWFLSRLVGMETALDWALSGEILDAETARAGGYTKRIVAPENLLDEAKALARRFTAETSPVSVAVNRQMIWRMAGASHPMEAHRLDTRVMLELSKADGREGVAAFNEKRKPEFAPASLENMPQVFDWESEPPFFEDNS